MNFNPELCRNETEVESKFLVQYLIPQLGYDPDSWYQEVALGRIRLDLLVLAARTMFKGTPAIRIVMEAKSPNQSLDRHVLRLRTYLRTLGARYGVLTNGKQFRVYELARGNRFNLVFQCLGHEVEGLLPTLRSLIGSERAIEGFLAAPMPREEEKVGFSMQTIAIYHNKGGVGKTTTVINLAAALRKRGLRVLVVDLDAQANTTFATGLVGFEDEEQDDLRDCNVFHLLSSLDLYPIADVVRKSKFCTPELDVVPSHITLMQQEVELQSMDTCRVALQRKLKAVSSDYDIVLVDTPPSLNLFARIALIAADHLIIPSDLKPFANQGLLNVLAFVKNVDEFRQVLGLRALNLLGILPSKLSTNSKFVQYTLAKRKQVVEKRYGVPLLKSEIFERDDLAKCTENIQRFGDDEFPMPQSVLDYSPDSQAAQEFEALANEVLSLLDAHSREVVACD